MGYEQPAVREKFSPRDNPLWYGKLFLIYPTRAETVEFQDGPSRIVTADVAIIDLIDPSTGKPTVLLGAGIGGKALVPQLEPLISKGVAAAGRLTKLPAQGQKDGAFKLDNFTPADAPALDAFELTAWRQTYAQPAATPTPAVAPAPAVPGTLPGVPSVAATPGPPWYGDPANTALLTKLTGAGVQGVLQMDLATASMIGASLPG